MKKIISIGAVLIASLIIFVYVPRAALAPQTAVTVSPVAAVPVPAAKPIAVPASSTPVRAAVPNAVLSVGTTTYPLSMTEGETVIGAMRALAAADSAFTFTGQDYPSLGFFVTSINGKENAGGFYWILYVNNASAPAGASALTVKSGDVITWKYEKGQ